MITLTTGHVIIYMLISFFAGGNLCIVVKDVHYDKQPMMINVLGMIGGCVMMGVLIVLLLI